MTVQPIEQHLQRAERRAVETLSLRSVALPGRFAHARGSWKDSPVTLTTRAFEGDSIALLRVAYVAGVQLSLATMLAIPRPNRALPVLSVDLARLGLDRDTSVAVDLTPMSEGKQRLADCEHLATSLPRFSPALPSEPPPWGPDWLSSNALYVRVGPARVPDALSIVDRSVDVWIGLAAGADPAPDAADATRTRLLAYAAARRADEQWTSLMGPMFGRAWWNEYVEKVLFPVV